jgi:L-glyceraldehyde 3-phosphate reductase
LASGYSEVLFGELFRAVGADPQTVSVSNKLWWEFWPRQTAVAELEQSLQRMGLARLALLYSSTLPDDVPVGVAVGQIAEVLATGRVDAWGVVNWSAEALPAAGREARTLGLAQPCAVQLPYSLARTDWVEDPAMERALADTGASLIPSAVLAGGALSGKYAEGASGRRSAELGDRRWARALELGAGGGGAPPPAGPPRRPRAGADSVARPAAVEQLEEAAQQHRLTSLVREHERLTLERAAGDQQ